MRTRYFVLVTLCASTVVAATYEETFTPKAGRAYNEDINVWVYTSEFAKRFGMPEKWVDDDLKGAYAVAFRVEVSSARLMFPHKGPDVSVSQRDCILDVYLSADAPLPWADGRISAARYYTPDSAAYLTPQSVRDRKWALRDIGIPTSGERSRRSLVHVTADGQVLGGLLVRGYDKAVYPGIAYLSFNKGCVSPPRQETRIDFSRYDDPYSPRGNYTLLHRIRLPSEFMERVYRNWNARSRQRAITGWGQVAR